MTGTEFQAAIAELGLSRKQAAEWLGVGLRSVERWCAQGVSGPVELCLQMQFTYRGDIYHSEDQTIYISPEGRVKFQDDKNRLMTRATEMLERQVRKGEGK